MIKDTLNVGCKIGTEKYAVTVQLRYPENDADIAELSGAPTSVVEAIRKATLEALDQNKNTSYAKFAAGMAFRVKMFTRGWSIWNQEQTGARDVVESATKAERDERKALTAKVQKVIDDADPTAPPKRSGRTQKPVVLNEAAIKAAMKKGDVNALAEMLAAAGIKNVSVSK